jgi:hypothetical protein
LIDVYCTVRLKVVSIIMLELNNQIARLEMRSEQLRIHLLSLSTGSAEAAQVRVELFGKLQNLVVLKTRRDRLQSVLGLEAAA